MKNLLKYLLQGIRYTIASIVVLVAVFTVAEGYVVVGIGLSMVAFFIFAYDITDVVYRFFGRHKITSSRKQ